MSQARENTTRVRPLNLTSMLDVCFLLLIFFIVTATFVPDEGILALPMIGEGPLVDPEIPKVGPHIHLRNLGGKIAQITINGEVTPIDGFAELYRHLERLNQSIYGPDSPATIHMDPTVSWQDVLDAVNQARAAQYQPLLAKPS